ncbi:MAG: acyltransferase [Ferruginibacter sp.]
MKRIKQIDGFRAIAILLVIAFHYIDNQVVELNSKISVIIYKLASFGWIGVDLFFVLSGFLIGSILLINKTSPNLFKTFFIRRFLRIVPNYYLLIILFVIILALPYFKEDNFIGGSNVIPLWSYVVLVHNLYMATMHTMGNEVMSVTWSIGIEEQFYILFPFIIVFVKDKLLPYLLVFIILLAIVFRSFCNHWIPAYVLLPCRMDAISFGILVAWLNINYNISLIVKKYYLAILTCIAIVIGACFFLYLKYQGMGITRNSLFAFVFSCLIIIALGKPNSYYSKILSNRLFAWIGKISYSLYLFHYLIIGIVNNIGGRFFNTHEINTRIGLAIASFFLSLLFSWIVYTFLEKPTVALGKRFNYTSKLKNSMASIPH